MFARGHRTLALNQECSTISWAHHLNRKPVSSRGRQCKVGNPSLPESDKPNRGSHHSFALEKSGFEIRSLKPTSLLRNIPPEVMRPIFNRCSNYWRSVKHQHQPLEGKTKNDGSRTQLAQIYPFSFCQDLAHVLLSFLKVKP